MSSSGLSSLSSAESIETDDEILVSATAKNSLDRYFQNAKAASPSPPPKRKRPASPPHEYVLADNQDIAFIVMFRARFSDAFPRSLLQFGPQDIEHGIVDSPPDEHVEKLLCALIGLVLNRKKDVEKGHYTRALEEAIQTNTYQWPREWDGKNPLHGGGSFNNMDPKQRLILMRSLVLWALNSSEAIQVIMKESYKQQRHEDDLNQPLSVQPWGRDGDKRRYWLVEGREDTHFRLYRESNPALKTHTWWSVADSIPGIKQIATKLLEEGSQASRRLHDRIHAAIPRFEAGDDKRKRREYRLARKAQFTRPEPGFSLYEGRTRGKRIRYTFSDDEGDGSDTLSTRRSTRQSGISTPAEPAGPTFTASGRQVKSRVGGRYGETVHSGQQPHQPAADGQGPELMNGEEVENSDGLRSSRGGRDQSEVNGRLARSRRPGYGNPQDSDEGSDAGSTGDEWEGGDDDDADDDVADDEAGADDDTDMEDLEEDDDDTEKSLIVSFKIPSRTADARPVSDVYRNGSTEVEDAIVLVPSASEADPPTANGFATETTLKAEHEHPKENGISTSAEPYPQHLSAQRVRPASDYVFSTGIPSFKLTPPPPAQGPVQPVSVTSPVTAPIAEKANLAGKRSEELRDKHAGSPEDIQARVSEVQQSNFPQQHAPEVSNAVHHGGSGQQLNGF